MKIILILIVYLTGVILSENMLLKLNIDKSEHKYKWLSWALVITLLMRNN